MKEYKGPLKKEEILKEIDDIIVDYENSEILLVQDYEIIIDKMCTLLDECHSYIRGEK